MRRDRFFFGFGGLVVVLAIAALGLARQKPAGHISPLPPPPPPSVDLPLQKQTTDFPPLPVPVDPPPTVKEAKVPPTEKKASIDDLLGELEALKENREAIEREEKAVRSRLKERLEAQRERMKKLGIDPVAPASDGEDKDGLVPPLSLDPPSVKGNGPRPPYPPPTVPPGAGD